MSTVPEFEIPTDDLANFDQNHFSTAHHAHLSSQFLPPPGTGYGDEIVIEEDVDDDGLGYYPDGTKRTLTDEQIAMFRFSEIQELLRRKRQNQERRRQHNERKARRRHHEDDEAQASTHAEAVTSENVSHLENHPAASPEETRKGRLEAAIWASSLPWDEQESGNQGKDVAPAAAPPVLARVDKASGKEFLWPAITKG